MVVIALLTPLALPAQTCALGPMSNARHSMVMDPSGKVMSWGYNNARQLGDGSDNNNCCNRFDRWNPGNVVKGTYVGTSTLGDNSSNLIVQAVAGYRHSLSVATDGTVFSWGSNNFGEAGTGVPGNNSLPVRVLKGAYSGTTYLGDNATSKIMAAAGGVDFSVALTQDGLVYTWGWNNSSQLGDNSTTDRATPVRVLKGAYPGTTYLGDNPTNKIMAIAVGLSHVLVLTRDGSVYTWGLNSSGQLGNNSTATGPTPVRVLKGAYAGTTYLGDNSSNPVIAIAAGGSQSMALMQDGTVFMWGLNADGQLGNNSTTGSLTPVKVLKGTYGGSTYLGDNASNKVIHISVGEAHALALTQDGIVFAWGDNAYGQLGDASIIDRWTPIRVQRGAYNGTTSLGDHPANPIIDISAGMSHSLVLDKYCGLYGFGRNQRGQIGDSTIIDRLTPVIIRQPQLPAPSFSLVSASGSLCKGATISVTLNVGGVFGPDNVFTAIASDANGSFASPTVLGVFAYNPGQQLVANITVDLPPGNGYRVRATSSSPALTSNDNGSNIQVFPLPLANIQPTGPTTFCQGDSVTLDAGSGYASYLWSNGATGRQITVRNSGSYSVTVTNVEGCPGVSAPVQIQVSPMATPNVASDGPTTFCQGGSVTLDAGSGYSTYLWSNGATTRKITVGNASNYSVTVTNANGCSAVSAPVPVQIAPAPTPIISAGATSFCEGDSVVLDAGNGYSSYLWSNGATTRTTGVKSGGSYSVTVTNAGGCGGTSTPFTVTVNPHPPVPTITQSGRTLTSSAAVGYQWYYEGSSIMGATEQQIEATKSGKYTVTTSNATGCTSSSAPTNVTVTSSVPSTGDNADVVHLFPDPAHTLVNVQITIPRSGTVAFTITDMRGERVMSFVDQGNAGMYLRTIPLQDLPQGTYFLEIRSGSSRWKGRFVKQ